MPRDSSPSGWSSISPLALLSLLVSCITAAVAVYAWTHLVSSQREHLQANLHSIARHCSDALERRAWSQTVALGDLAHTWSAFAPKPEAEWKHEASALLKQHPSIRELRWTNGSTVRRLYEGDATLLPESDAPLHDAEERIRSGMPRALVSPVRFTDGTYGFVVFLGAPGAGPEQAVLRATFDYPAFAARALEDRVNGYAFTLWNGDVAVAQGAGTPAAGLDWWQAAETAAHPIGTEWRVQLRPTAAIARQELSILPHVLLATGLLAAAMIGALLWTWRVAARRARTMVVANAAMREIAERAQPEATPRADSGGVESTVLERAEELREAVLDLEAFNVSVSHDLRSPIGAIVNLTAVLRETNPQLDAAALDLVHRIDRSAMRALARMDALLDFSRLGRKPLRRELVDLHRLAWRITRELRQNHASDRVEFVLDSVPNGLGDAAMLEVLLRNLLDNAVKFSRGEEKPRVEFGALSGEEGGDPTYFVRDNGVGFDPKYADKVFGLFERQHHASEFEGTGVGLAIVSRIARRHGGRAWAEGDLGGGATFYFTLGPGRD